MSLFVYSALSLAQANADANVEALARDSDLVAFTPRITVPGGPTDGSATDPALVVRQSCPPGFGICLSGRCCPLNSVCCLDGRCCPSDSLCCSDGVGCCSSGSFCVVVNGRRGCCPIGKVCAR